MHTACWNQSSASDTCRPTHIDLLENTVWHENTSLLDFYLRRLYFKTGVPFLNGYLSDVILVIVMFFCYLEVKQHWSNKKRSFYSLEEDASEVLKLYTCRKIFSSFVDRYKYTRCGQPTDVQRGRESDSAQGVAPSLLFPSSLPLLLWRSPGLQIFCVQYTRTYWSAHALKSLLLKWVRVRTWP
jgi:hypothetical protein